MKNDLKIKNISNKDEEYFKIFKQKIDKLDCKIKFLISSVDYKIMLANKNSDCYSKKEIEKLIKEVSKYKENYTKEIIDKIFRGICSDTNKKICVFSNNVAKEKIGFILYHEIGHFLDMCNDAGKFIKFYLSTKDKFVKAYKKDLKGHWEDIKQDKRYKLIHLVQNSTPDNPNEIAMAETFANCFAKIMGEVDEIDFIDLYFKNTLSTTREIINDFLFNITPPAPTL